MNQQQFKEIETLIKTDDVGFIEEFIWDYVKDCNYIIFLRNQEGKLIGCLLAETNVDFSNDKRKFIKQIIKSTNEHTFNILRLFFLTPDVRKKGYGKQLLKHFINDSNSTIIELGTSQEYDYQFYDKLKFHKIHEFKQPGQKCLSWYYVYTSDKKKMNVIRKI